MPLTNPKTLYGIHSATFYNRTDRSPIAFLRVLGDASFELAGETEDLMGGSSMYPWDSEASSINSEISFTAREYPIEAMNLLLAGQISEYASVTAGRIDDIEDVNGSIYNDTGVEDVQLSVVEGETPKEGEYVVVATAAGVVDVYGLSNVDFGTSDYLDDTLKIATGLVITTSGETEVEGFGFKLVGGDSTDGIGMTIGNSMKFSVRRGAVSGVKMVVGQIGSTFDEFGCILTGQKSGSGAITYLDIYRCKAVGMPINFAEKAYSEWSISLKALYDSTKNGVFEYIRNS